MIGGLGGAAFHPPAAALVHADRRAQGARDVYAHLGRLAGFALAPVVFAPFVARGGLPWARWSLPGLLALTYTLRLMPPMSSHPREHESRIDTVLRPAAKPLTLLYVIVVLRTLTANSFMVFPPALLTDRAWASGEASAAVSLYLVVSGIGGFLGGPLADRIGARRVIIWTLVASVPFLLGNWHLGLVASR